MPQLNDPRLTAWSTAHSLRLYLWRLTESEEDLSALLPTHFNYIDEARRRFQSPKRRREWLAARVLLHHVAGVSERLQYLPSGQPMLPAFSQYSSGQRASALHVSISHTADVVALLLSPTPCGIDVEQRSPRALRLRAHFLDATEEAAFFSPHSSLSLSAEDTAVLSLEDAALSPEDTATLLWSTKEAVFKCFSARGIEFVTQIHLRPTADTTALTASFAADTPCAAAKTSVAFSLHPDFVLTACLAE